MTEPAAGLLRLLEAFDRLQTQYMVVGSGASSIHGMWRSTGDIDIVARIRPHDIEPLVDVLHQDFYIDAGQIRTAIETGRSFNLVHFRSSYKFDVFPLTADRYQEVQFARGGW